MQKLGFVAVVLLALVVRPTAVVAAESCRFSSHPESILARVGLVEQSMDRENLRANRANAIHSMVRRGYSAWQDHHLLDSGYMHENYDRPYVLVSSAQARSWGLNEGDRFFDGRSTVLVSSGFRSVSCVIRVRESGDGLTGGEAVGLSGELADLLKVAPGDRVVIDRGGISSVVTFEARVREAFGPEREDFVRLLFHALDEYPGGHRLWSLPEPEAARFLAARFSIDAESFFIRNTPESNRSFVERALVALRAQSQADRSGL